MHALIADHCNLFVTLFQKDSKIIKNRHILCQCSIPDVIAVSMALATPSLTDIFKITKLLKQAVIGPRMLDRSVHFLGDHLEQLIIRGRQKLET